MGTGSSVPSKRKLQSIIFLKLYNNDRSTTVKQRLYEAFDETDSSGDGFISKQEFRDVLGKLKLEVEEPKCSAIFDVFDVDNSGQIDRQEFLGFMGYEEGVNDTDGNTTKQARRQKMSDVQRMRREEEMAEYALRLEVYRKIPGSGVVFLGQVGYDGSRLLDFPENVSTKVEQTLREKPEDGCDQSFVGGDLQYRITRMSVLTVKIKSANGLAKADMMGKSDPFVVVKMNNEVRHKTTVMKKTLNPVWDNETLTVALPTLPKKLGKTVLQLEVYDKDMMGQEFLGRVTFKGEEILEKTKNGGEVTSEYQLVGEAGVQTKKHKGSITLSLQHVEQMRVVVAEVRKMIDPMRQEQPAQESQNGSVWAEAAKEANAAVTASQITCKVLWKEKEIGQTGEVACTGNHAGWEDKATFLFPCTEITD